MFVWDSVGVQFLVIMYRDLIHNHDQLTLSMLHSRQNVGGIQWRGKKYRTNIYTTCRKVAVALEDCDQILFIRLSVFVLSIARFVIQMTIELKSSAPPLCVRGNPEHVGQRRSMSRSRDSSSVMPLVHDSKLLTTPRLSASLLSPYSINLQNQELAFLQTNLSRNFPALTK